MSPEGVKEGLNGCKIKKSIVNCSKNLVVVSFEWHLQKEYEILLMMEMGSSGTLRGL